jgi:phage-related holin
MLKKLAAVILPYLVFFFSPIYPLLFTVGILVFADLLTGVFAAKKRGEVIHSKTMARTVSKCIFYFIAIILGRLMELNFLQGLPIANITAGYIALTEFKSNIENIDTITGTNIVKAVINKIHSKK